METFNYPFNVCMIPDYQISEKKRIYKEVKNNKELKSILKDSNNGAHIKIEANKLYSYFGDIDHFNGNIKETLNKIQTALTVIIRENVIEWQVKDKEGNYLYNIDKIIYTENNNYREKGLSSHHYIIPSIKCDIYTMKMCNGILKTKLKDYAEYLDDSVYRTGIFRLQNQIKGDKAINKNWTNGVHIVKNGEIMDFNFIPNEDATELKISAEASKPKTNKKANSAEVSESVIMRLINGLNETRANNYDEWIKAGFAFKSANLDVKYYHEFSKLCADKYDAKAVDYQYANMKPRKDADRKITMRTLWNWLREDNVDEFIKLTKETSKEKVIENDDEGAVLILNKYGNRLVICDNVLYMKTSDNIWSNESQTIERELSKMVLDENIMKITAKGAKVHYSKNLTGKNSIIPIVKDRCRIDNDFIKTLRLKSKGKLFFKNGVYDFAISKFRDETDDDMTPIRINKDYPKNIDMEAREELLRIINSIFDDEKQCINMLQHGARGLAGCIEDKDFVIGTGLRDCGKGILTRLFAQSFGVYVSEVNANNFLGTKRIGATDEAKNRMWLLPHMWSRLLFANECDIDNGNDKAIINGVLIKSLMSGGDPQKARALWKSEIEFVFGGRLIMFMNDLPEIKPIDTCSHMALFEFPNKFINPEEYKEKKHNKELLPFEKKGDPNLSEKLKDEKYVNAFISIVLEHYVNHPVKNNEKVVEASKEFRKDSGDELLFYKEAFDYSDNKIFTSSAEIYEAVNKKYPEMSKIKIKSFLVNNMKLKYAQKKVEGVNERGFFGIRIIEEKDR